MTDKWNLIVDVALCENCQNCVLTNKDEHVGQGFAGYAAPMPKHGAEWIKITRRTRGSGHLTDANYLVTMCNHCDDAPCIKASGGAIRKRADGIVVIDPVSAKGRQDLVAACPYGHISWNAEENVPQAWTFDAHLLDQGWKEPRASHACPTEALVAVKISDDAMAARAKAEALEVIAPEKGTKPRIWYRNLHRITKDFVAGSVLCTTAGVVDVVEGAKVTVTKAGALIGQAVTDTFGDFRIDGLTADGAEIEILVTSAAGRTKAAVPLTGSVCLPDLMLR